jgi:hypothetical protein
VMFINDLIDSRDIHNLYLALPPAANGPPARKLQASA